MTLITVAEAAKLAKRHVSRIYRWIEDGKLGVSIGNDGVRRVDGAAVLKLESEVKRGRPTGSARPSATRRPKHP